MSLADRLRRVVRSEPALLDGPPRGPQGSAPHGLGRDSIAETLGGEWCETRGHRYLVVDTRYAPGYRHGRVAVAECLPDQDGLWPGLSLLGSPAARGRLLFVDLETTGLAGGAGTYAFLVGCGWFEGAAFRVRQFFLASYGAERALLDAVADAARTAGGVVTYNGKTFDLPLIETRFLFHRMETPFAGLPHVDMLHPARHLWRQDRHDMASPCRLTTVEEALLGHVREDDVPGFEIPSRYFHYVRTNDARPLCAVLEHNRLDLLALAMLTALAAQLLEEGPAAARTAREALGLGRLYEHGGMIPAARACYARAVALCSEPANHLRQGRVAARPDQPALAGRSAFADRPGGPPKLYAKAEAGPHDVVACAEALRAYALSCRRDRDYAEAAAAWRRVLDLHRCPAHIAREATEALAVHHEHRARDLPAARRFALQSLQLTITAGRAQAVQYRLARLDRKLGAPSVKSVPLF